MLRVKGNTEVMGIVTAGSSSTPKAEETRGRAWKFEEETPWKGDPIAKGPWGEAAFLGSCSGNQRYFDELGLRPLRRDIAHCWCLRFHGASAGMPEGSTMRLVPGLLEWGELYTGTICCCQDEEWLLG